jgi:hypothetical protein
MAERGQIKTDLTPYGLTPAYCRALIALTTAVL